MGPSDIGMELDRCLDCQICVGNRCTGNVWREFEGKIL